MKDELRERGLSDQAISVIEPILSMTGTVGEKIATMRGLMNGSSATGIVSEVGIKGLDELEELFGLIDSASLSQEVEMDLSLADRIYDVLKGLGKFPTDLATTTTILFANMDAAVLPFIIPVAKALRERGVSVEIYPDKSKLKKQFDYAAKKGIPFLSICGSNEMEAGKINVKNLGTGVQQEFAASDIEGIMAFLA